MGSNLREILETRYILKGVNLNTKSRLDTDKSE
jgi:hypothetical protein